MKRLFVLVLGTLMFLSCGNGQRKNIQLQKSELLLKYNMLLYDRGCVIKIYSDRTLDLVYGTYDMEPDTMWNVEFSFKDTISYADLYELKILKSEILTLPECDIDWSAKDLRHADLFIDGKRYSYYTFYDQQSINPLFYILHKKLKSIAPKEFVWYP